MTTCAKCSDPAQVTLGISYPDKTAWLEDIGPGFDRFTQIPLCEMHADRVSAPNGWEVIDDRMVEPPLFLALDVA